MRIVSGKYRGRVLSSPKNDDVRPTTDMIKESVFNVIQNYIPNCNFLDLFAGSGAMGIEAISRGASKVVFVDKSRDSARLVEENLAKIGEKAMVINTDFKSALARLKGEKFDVIYLDPPFIYTDIQEMLREISMYNVLADDGIVVYESLYNKCEKPNILGYILQKSKKYGTISIDIYEKVKADE